MSTGGAAALRARRTAENSASSGPPGAIDTHHHLVPPVLREALAARAARDAAFARRFDAVVRRFAVELDDVEHRLAEMDAAGISCAVLAAPPPGAEVAGPSGQAELARQVNEELLACAARHPGRFLVALCLPGSPSAAAVECARLADNASVRAVSLLCHLEGALPDDPSYDGLYRLCAERGLAVLLHPAMDGCGEALAPWQLESALGAPFATTLVALRLVLSGTLDRHPELDVVVPHLGGVAPYLLQRIEDQSSPGEAAHRLSTYWRERFFLDTCSFHPPALACAASSSGPGRLMLGSDYPFRGPLARAVTDLDNLPPGERVAAAWATPARWFAAEAPEMRTDRQATPQRGDAEKENQYG